MLGSWILHGMPGDHGLLGLEERLLNSYLGPDMRVCKNQGTPTGLLLQGQLRKGFLMS